MDANVVAARRPRISAVFNTFNEEKRLRFALRSVKPWVDEIVVVDMHSSDATRTIAENFGAKVFLHEPLGYADPARAFAVAQATGDWILMLDADRLGTDPGSS
jgi:glycosyltransferase involved in cell wall biosynthesis